MLAHADTANTDLGKLLSGVQTMQANFTQTVYDNRGKTIQKSYGHMSMERPGKFRWEVTKPIPQLIIANGSKLWIYDPDLEQVTIRSLKKSAGDAPALLLSHVNTTIEKDYAVKKLTNADVNKQSFSLIPKQADNMFERVKMSFANGQISEMDLVDHLGHTTHIQFKDIHSNLKLASSLFVFKAAANIDVIDETKAG
jgi:outer membrane lipoprotein carrier protein